jgi:ferric-dicitrate binding protein FerR (iron transport regulator)
MANDPDLRAGDEDRDRTISLIREAYAEGRLDGDEFQERMGQAQQARTFGDLDALVRDLPGRTAVAPQPDPPSVPAEADEHRRKMRSGWAAWAGAAIMTNVIWAATWVSGGGSAPNYWPIWVMGPWGAVMVIATINGRSR